MTRRLSEGIVEYASAIVEQSHAAKAIESELSSFDVLLSRAYRNLKATDLESRGRPVKNAANRV